MCNFFRFIQFIKILKNVLKILKFSPEFSSELWKQLYTRLLNWLKTTQENANQF